MPGRLGDGDFQLFDPLAPEEYEALKADIARRGVLVPVEMDEEGNILDGHHRARACRELGIRDYPCVVRRLGSVTEKEEHVVALNLRRRHLSGEQKRRWAEWLLRRHPEWSDRRVAGEVGVSPTTVGSVRERLEQQAEVSNVDSRVGRDGLARPARRAPHAAPAGLQPGLAPQAPPSVFVGTPREARRVERALSLLGEAGVPLPEAPASAVIDAAEITRLAGRVRREQARELAASVPPAPIPDAVRIEVADATALPLDDGCVDLIVTSPPYGLEKRYPQWKDEAASWMFFTQEWLREAFRVAREGGRLAVNLPLDTTRGGCRPAYAQAVELALVVGWSYRFSIVWHEGNVSRSLSRGSVDSAAAPHVIAPVETIAVFSRGEWGRSSAGRQSDLEHEEWLAWTNGLWTFPGEARPWEGHPAAFPEELPRRLVRLLSFVGDTVLDPFVGSGTTALVGGGWGGAPSASTGPRSTWPGHADASPRKQSVPIRLVDGDGRWRRDGEGERDERA